MSDEGGGGGHSGVWLISYADMVTLIMAFFVIMYSMSQVDAEKLRALVDSMHSAFSPSLGLHPNMGGPGANKIQPGSAGLVDGGAVSPPMAPGGGDGDSGKGGSPTEKALAKVAAEVTRIAAQAHLSGQLKAKVTARGTVVTFAESSGGLVPFLSGSAALNPAFERLLDALAPVLAKATTKIEVQGHTDRLPIHTPAFPSNWELSAARAGSVVRYMVERHSFPPDQWVCTGFADTIPADTSDTPVAWARNRRVEIVITRQAAALYDKMTRADATTKRNDITRPLGYRIVAPNVAARH
ncbi:MAG: flagellar motor protein MotB [Armatimonadetes bacterium]|nr:flagellar motor protein MotB [Armatimonadota bacterium]